MTTNKKVLFIIPSYRYGGTTTSLRSLLPILKRAAFDVSIFSISDEGQANIEFSKYASIIHFSTTDTESSKRFRQLISLILRTAKKTLCSVGIDISPLVFKRIAKNLSRHQFDYVVSYQEGQATLLGSYITAHKKIAWQHSMINRFLSLIDAKHYLPILNHFDQIVCVSNTEKKEFESVLPSFSRKLTTVYNVIDIDFIEEKASQKSIQFNHSVKNIISVGRIDTVKRFSLIPKLASALNKAGLSFIWRILGGVAEKKEYDALVSGISQYDVADQVLLCGKEDNPYPFIKNSDLLVCLSSSETFNYTIAEAKVFGIPVVSTDFESVFEFIEDGVTGMIRPIETVALAILEILTNESLYNSISRMCYETRMIDSEIINKQLDIVFGSPIT